MKKRCAYHAADIKTLDVPRLLATITTAVVVSIDVAKAAFVAAIQTATDGVIRIIRFEHPTETRLFLELVQQLRERAGSLLVLMEPTGTYGDPIRYQLQALGIPIRMVQPKHTHDAKEVFDHVPSAHDPKDAVTMAKLHAAGASTEWKSLDVQRRALRAMFDQYAVHEAGRERLSNQIEALLARHWPELEAWLSIRKHVSARSLLEQYASPQCVASEPERARDLLRRASRGALSSALIDGVIASARNTLGVPMLDEEATFLKDLVVSLRRENEACDELEARMQKATDCSGPIARMREVVGVMTAAAIVAYLGSPANYVCARAFLKAAGLNMREDSSGTEKSNVHITKRGPSILRKLLYMAALRTTIDRVAGAWYRSRKTFRSDNKTAAVVALMRKLLTGAYHVGKHDVPYDPAKLFDTRRLTLVDAGVDTRRAPPKPRTQPRSIARRAPRTRAANAGGASA